MHSNNCISSLKSHECCGRKINANFIIEPVVVNLVIADLVASIAVQQDCPCTPAILLCVVFNCIVLEHATYIYATIGTIDANGTSRNDIVGNHIRLNVNCHIPQVRVDDTRTTGIVDWVVVDVGQCVVDY